MDAKPPKRYTPTEAASIIGISPNSLRNWCATFKEHLSEGATPAPGTDRILTDKDIGILQRVKEMRAEHRTYDYIKNELATLPAETELAPYIDVQATATLPEPLQPPTVATMPSDVLQALQSLADGRHDALVARIEAMEAQRRDNLQWFVFGIVTGVILVGVVVMIVLAGAWLG